ncbi:MAG TPA: TolC family protein [bacterium]|nr:TolC family protein [bacterium]
MPGRLVRSVAFIALAATALLPLTAAAQTQPAQPPVPSSPTQPTQPPASSGPAMVIPPVPPVPSVGGGAPLTLLDAVRRALEQNLSVRQAALAVAIARAQVGQAEAGLWPTVSVGASNTQQTPPGNSTLGGTINIPSAGITGAPFTAVVPGAAPPQWNVHGTFQYAVYTGNAVQDQIAIAQANLRGQQSAFAATAGQTVLAVRQAYFNYVQSEGQVAAAQRAVVASQENVRVTQAQVNVGTSPEFNLLQAQVQLAQAQRTLTQAKAAAVQAEQQLAAVVNLPISSAIAATTPMGLPAPPQDVEALVKQGLSTRPEIAQAQAAIQAAQAAVDLAAAGLRPNITLTGGPQMQSNTLSTSTPVTWAGTLALTLAIFDGGLTKAKVEQARQQLALTRVQREQTQQTVEEQVRAAYLNLQQAAESLASAQAGLTAAQEALRIAGVRFQAGVGTQLEVVTAIQNLAAADAAVVQALFQYNLALAQIDQAVGNQITL